METNNPLNLHESRFDRPFVGVIDTDKKGYFMFQTLEHGFYAALVTLNRMDLDDYSVSCCITRWPDSPLNPVEYDLFGDTLPVVSNSPLVPYTEVTTFICRQLRCAPQDLMCPSFYKDFLLYLARLEQNYYDPRWSIALENQLSKFLSK